LGIDGIGHVSKMNIAQEIAEFAESLIELSVLCG
jgi:hypothetical protein